MAYIGFEDIPARTINNRIVPTLRKYYRADGSFDLFDIYNKQQNCLKFLADRGEAALYAADRYPDFPLGTYKTTITWGNNDGTNFNNVVLFRQSAYSYNAFCQCAFRLQLDNVAGLYPYTVFLQSSSGHGWGGHWIYKINNNNSEALIAGGGGNGSVTWSPAFGNAAQMIDWKDCKQIYGYARGGDGTKFVDARTWINISFVHRFSTDHPLYRFYR